LGRAMTTLKEELSTTADFQNVQHEVFLSLLVTVDRISRRHVEFMQSFGISPKQYNILRILRGSGKQGIPVMGDRAQDDRKVARCQPYS
jgi:DNA-binding MarR family transcriptional regulator